MSAIYTTGNYKNIAAGATTLIASGSGVLHNIVINGGTLGVITIYDSLTATGTKIGTIDATATRGTYQYDVSFGTGLTIVTAAATDITVSWVRG